MKSKLYWLIWPIMALAPAASGAWLQDAYGVWVRGGRYDLKEFPYRGVEIDLKWEDVQPSENVFAWKAFDEELERVAGLGLYACIGVNVGPMSPTWLYDKGIPKVMTPSHRIRKGPYPYYLDPRHVSYYHHLIEEFGKHVRGLPPRLTGRIVFVQVKTGSTGDEAPTKERRCPPVTPLPPGSGAISALPPSGNSSPRFNKGRGP